MSAALATADFEVRWSDLDAFGHANNACFMTYAEEARLRWLQSLPEPWVTEDIGPLLAAVEMNYRRPVGWPETLRISLHVLRAGTSSLSIAHRIGSATDPAAHYADGHCVMVWVDRRSGRPTGLPAFLRAAVEATGTQ